MSGPVLLPTSTLRAISGASTQQVSYWRIYQYLRPVALPGPGRYARYGWPWAEVVICRDMVTLVRAGRTPAPPPCREGRAAGGVVSLSTYRAALARYRETLDLLGPFRGPSFCGWPDARHRQADSLLGSWLAGEAPEVMAAEYLPEDTPDALVVALEVALATLAVDRRLHGLTRDQEWQTAREVYAACEPV